LASLKAPCADMLRVPGWDRELSRLTRTPVDKFGKGSGTVAENACPHRQALTVAERMRDATLMAPYDIGGLVSKGSDFKHWRYARARRGLNTG